MSRDDDEHYMEFSDTILNEEIDRIFHNHDKNPKIVRKFTNTKKKRIIGINHNKTRQNTNNQKNTFMNEFENNDREERDTLHVSPVVDLDSDKEIYSELRSSSRSRSLERENQTLGQERLFGSNEYVEMIQRIQTITGESPYRSLDVFFKEFQAKLNPKDDKIEAEYVLHELQKQYKHIHEDIDMKDDDLLTNSTLNVSNKELLNL